MKGVMNMKAECERADVALTRRGLAPSRARAQALIAAGLVTLNGIAIAKPSTGVTEADCLQVCGADHPYVSRGGLKLEKALKRFQVDPAGMVAMDIGASTGGFTDVLLQNGARRVYAIDVGTGQLDPRLSADPRVASMEHVNARQLRPDMFPEKPVLAVMDVSFISIRLILPAAFAVLGEGGRMLSLIKPQFEAGRDCVGKHGIVRKPSVHEAVLKSIVEFAPTLGWQVRDLDFSPISGSDGNLEFLADFVPETCCAHGPSSREIEALVRTAHAAVPL